MRNVDLKQITFPMRVSLFVYIKIRKSNIRLGAGGIGREQSLFSMWG
jgi:hypothetical protein